MDNHIHSHEECKKYLTMLSDYIDGDLDAGLCSRLEAHMAECENCTIVVNTLKKTIELYHTADQDEEETLPDDIKSRLFKRLSIDDLLK
jgi:anti-sigma factor RsiW